MNRLRSGKRAVCSCSWFFCQFEHQQLTKVWSHEHCFLIATSGHDVCMFVKVHPLTPPPPHRHTPHHRQFKSCTCTCACVCACPSLRPQLGKPGGLSHSQRKEQSWPVYLPLITSQLRTDCRGNKGLIVSTRLSQRTSYFLQAADSHCCSS